MKREQVQSAPVRRLSSLLTGLCAGVLCGALLTAAGCAVAPNPGADAKPADAVNGPTDATDVRPAADHALLWTSDVERALPPQLRGTAFSTSTLS